MEVPTQKEKKKTKTREKLTIGKEKKSKRENGIVPYYIPARVSPHHTLNCAMESIILIETKNKNYYLQETYP